MTMSLKMLADIAIHAQAMADEAQAMAAAMKVIVDDCAEQLAAKKAGNESVDARTNTAPEPEWINGAEASLVNAPLPDGPVSDAQLPDATTAKKHSLTEVRAFGAERTTPKTRAQIKAILSSFGVSKLTELPEDKYPVRLAIHTLR